MTEEEHEHIKLESKNEHDKTKDKHNCMLWLDGWTRAAGLRTTTDHVIGRNKSDGRNTNQRNQWEMYQLDKLFGKHEIWIESRKCTKHRFVADVWQVETKLEQHMPASGVVNNKDRSSTIIEQTCRTSTILRCARFHSKLHSRLGLMSACI